MSEEDKKVIENLLNINPINMSYEQLVSMQNGWWETLKLLSEQNKENKQLKHQLQQKEAIIEEAKTFIENKIEYLKKCKYFKVIFYDEDNMKHEWNEQLLYKENELLKILNDLSKGE